MAAEPLNAPDSWLTYKQLPGLVLGFHGCDRDAAEEVLSGRRSHLVHSSNEYDWLGGGIYFWERDPRRALSWACESQRAKRTARPVQTPYVVGAVIELGRCCNLLDFDTLEELLRANKFIEEVYKASGHSLPENQGGEDLLRRFRDKIVVESMHALREVEGLQAYQTVRAAFLEGSALYEGAGFRRKNHIQIAVKDARCIKAYFRLPDHP